jgi:hypothetical protein
MLRSLSVKLKEQNVKLARLANVLRITRPTLYRYIELFDQNKKIVESIVPAKNKIAIFPNMSHARGYTLPGETRVVWVVTFEMEKKNAKQS